MKRILLVEPEYCNKFPPIGLMKIATFHRAMGDYVEFFKGEAPYVKISQMDRVYITTLFTFHYDITIKCIRHYAKFSNKNNIYVGGIAASLMPDKFRRDTKIDNILVGQLTDSRILGDKKSVNIDLLPLDYDILDDVNYRYPAEDNYFIHTTRGCPRKCEFCAVKDLEPDFFTLNEFKQQVLCVDAIYGKKRNLLVMDNNILFSPDLIKIVEDISSLGFNGKAEYIRPNPFIQILSKIKRRRNFGSDITRQLDEMAHYLAKFSKSISRYRGAATVIEDALRETTDREAFLAILHKYEEPIIEITEKYRSKPRMIRYVDLNQGIDARKIDKKNMAILATIPVRPFRLAFDGIGDTSTFLKATKIAISCGVKEFSNYMLYNWKDKPGDLWSRLRTAVKVYNEKERITGFSFPMRYTPTDFTDRTYIGKYWNKKYLSAIGVILNVTKGVVAKDTNFFYEAFGKSKKEFIEILLMPNEFIRYRHFFRDCGFISCWKRELKKLSTYERRKLLECLCEQDFYNQVSPTISRQLSKIIKLYFVTKHQVEAGIVKAPINTKKKLE